MLTSENTAACASQSALRRAMEGQQVLEGIALLCDEGHNLKVSLGPFTGVIPREEAALGIKDGSTREIAILSRVGKPVCFVVTDLAEQDGVLTPILSRRKAQQRALTYLLQTLQPGMVIPATVTHLENFGVFVDVACGVASMIGIENISISRIPHPKCRFTPGQEIYAAVLAVDQSLRRIYLTHKELLGTWQENAARFSPGITVPGTVRGIQEYGIFIELTANLSGLAEIHETLEEGDRVSVYIKAIVPERMKIKLLAIDKLSPAPSTPAPLSYFITSGQLEHWRYAPPGCTKPGCDTYFSAAL